MAGNFHVSRQALNCFAPNVEVLPDTPRKSEIAKVAKLRVAKLQVAFLRRLGGVPKTQPATRNFF